MSVPRYESYRDSEVEWLGGVPSHWDVKSLKRGLRLVTERTDRRSWAIGLENIEGWSGRLLETDADFEGEGVGFEAGDILYGKLRPYLAKVYVAERPGEAVGDFHVLRSEMAVLPQFVAYQLRTHEVVSQLNGSTFGARMPRVGWEFMGGLPLAFPPLAEQTAIAAFLDRETGKIDALVEAQRRLIELLKEKRQAVISHAVTKGLDPAAPMKDSGVEWLGEVPAHWEVATIGSVALEVQTGPFGSQLHAEDYVEGGVPVINPSNIRDGCIVADDKITATRERASLLSQHKLQVGDLIVARRGEMGRCAVTQQEQVGWLCGTGSLRVRFGDRLRSDFAAHALRTPYIVEQLKLTSVGATMDNLNASILSSIKLPLPPKGEQELIVCAIQEQQAALDALCRLSEAAIDTLQERRAALISAAVTGKIDVRGLVPDHAEAA